MPGVLLLVPSDIDSFSVISITSDISRSREPDLCCFWSDDVKKFGFGGISGFDDCIDDCIDDGIDDSTVSISLTVSITVSITVVGSTAVDGSEE